MPAASEYNELVLNKCECNYSITKRNTRTFEIKSGLQISSLKDPIVHSVQSMNENNFFGNRLMS